MTDRYTQGWADRGKRDAEIARCEGLACDNSERFEGPNTPFDKGGMGAAKRIETTIRAVPAPEAAAPAESTACPACDGRGGEFVVNSPAGMFQRWRTCETCAGTGADQAKLAAMFSGPLASIPAPEAAGETPLCGAADIAKIAVEAATIARYDAKLAAADKRIAELEDRHTAKLTEVDKCIDELKAENAALKAGRVTDEMVERAGKALIRRQIMRNMRYEQKPWPEDKIIECIEWTWAHRENTGFEADARAALGGGAK